MRVNFNIIEDAHCSLIEEMVESGSGLKGARQGWGSCSKTFENLTHIGYGSHY